MANLAIQKVDTLYQSGLSAREVGERFGVSPWVVYKFMKRRGLSRRGRGETNRIHFKHSPLSYKLKRQLSAEEDKLKLAGTMLYWAEWSKANAKTKEWNVDFANSNPDMVRTFLQFLREICGVDEGKLRIYLYCYADQNVEEIKNYWSKITNIPLSQFTKPYIREDFQKKNGREMKCGMVHVRYSDKRLLLQIENWIKDYIQTRVGTQAVNGVTL